MKFIFEVQVKGDYTVEDYAAAWQEASAVIQQAPGARGTYLHRKLGEPDKLLAIAHWDSKEARDAKNDSRDARVREILARHAQTTNTTILGEYAEPEWQALPPEPALRLYAVRVFCRDFDRCRVFYRDTLNLPETFASAEQGWAQFDLGGPSLGLERVAAGAEQEALVGRFVGASLQVTDIAHRYQLLSERGVDFLSPPERQPWGGTLAHFRDPDGNVLTLLGEA